MMKQSGEKLTTTSILVNVGYKDDSVMFGINFSGTFVCIFWNSLRYQPFPTCAN